METFICYEKKAAAPALPANRVLYLTTMKFLKREFIISNNEPKTYFFSRRLNIILELEEARNFSAVFLFCFPSPSPFFHLNIPPLHGNERGCEPYSTTEKGWTFLLSLLASNSAVSIIPLTKHYNLPTGFTMSSFFLIFIILRYYPEVGKHPN